MIECIIPDVVHGFGKDGDIRKRRAAFEHSAANTGRTSDHHLLQGCAESEYFRTKRCHRGRNDETR